MQRKDELGRLGEQLAEKYMTEKGYEILFRNWRHSRFELDLVAVSGDVLHFIEVKTRKTTQFGFPEEAVDTVKIRCLIEAGEAFLYQHRHYKKVQFDVLAICMRPNKDIEYFLIEDVYL